MKISHREQPGKEILGKQAGRPRYSDKDPDVQDQAGARRSIQFESPLNLKSTGADCSSRR